MDIEREYARRRPDGHFFDKKTKACFSSKTESRGYPMPHNELAFITSEQFDRDSSPRLFTVRVMGGDGSIREDDRGFQGYETYVAAAVAVSAMLERAVTP